MSQCVEPWKLNESSYNVGLQRGHVHVLVHVQGVQVGDLLSLSPGRGEIHAAWKGSLGDQLVDFLFLKLFLRGSLTANR